MPEGDACQDPEGGSITPGMAGRDGVMGPKGSRCGPKRGRHRVQGHQDSRVGTFQGSVSSENNVPRPILLGTGRNGLWTRGNACQDPEQGRVRTLPQSWLCNVHVAAVSGPQGSLHRGPVPRKGGVMGAAPGARVRVRDRIPDPPARGSARC